MISFDGSGLPFELIAAACIVMAVSYAATGLFAESTWRQTSLKDIELASRLRDIGTVEAIIAAEDCERAAIKKVDAHQNKTNVASLVFGVLVRGMPYFLLMMVIWLLYQVWLFVTVGFDPMECLASFVYWLVAALATEGLASIMGRFVTPLSERRARDAANADYESEE